MKMDCKLEAQAENPTNVNVVQYDKKTPTTYNTLQVRKEPSTILENFVKLSPLSPSAMLRTTNTFTS